jgi:all-trans-retinol 13,14-reductase
VDLYNLRESQGPSNLFSGDNDFLMPTSEFIAKYVSDERLRSVLAYMNPLHGGMAGNTPAYVHTLISILYINGESRFIDGSSHLAELLAGVITDHGGEISTAEAAEWLQVTDRHVDYLRTSKGRQLVADWYVSDIHPCTLLKLMDAHAFPKSYRDRLDSIPNAHSAFSLYLKMKENSFPYINHTEYFMTRYTDIWNFSRSDKPWPLGLMMMTPPVTGQGPWSRKVLVTAPMPFNMAARWEHTQTGRRGADYEQWKREKADALLALIEEMHPGFREGIEQMETSSPLTIRDYYAVKDGSISGFAKDCRNIALSQVPVVTKIHNLLLTGQNCNLHGICGVPLTAITTCEAILGLNHIIRRINACTEP